MHGKRNLILTLLLVTALIFTACGKIKVNVDVSASVDVKTSEPWLLSDGLIDVKEFDGMVDMDSYQEFHLQP